MNPFDPSTYGSVFQDVGKQAAQGAVQTLQGAAPGLVQQASQLAQQQVGPLGQAVGQAAIPLAEQAGRAPAWTGQGDPLRQLLDLLLGPSTTGGSR